MTQVGDSILLKHEIKMTEKDFQKKCDDVMQSTLSEFEKQEELKKLFITRTFYSFSPKTRKEAISLLEAGYFTDPIKAAMFLTKIPYDRTVEIMKMRNEIAETIELKSRSNIEDKLMQYLSPDERRIYFQVDSMVGCDTQFQDALKPLWYRMAVREIIKSGIVSSQREMGEILEIEAERFKHIMKCDVTPTSEEMELLRCHFNVTVDWMSYGKSNNNYGIFYDSPTRHTPRKKTNKEYEEEQQRRELAESQRRCDAWDRYDAIKKSLLVADDDFIKPPFFHEEEEAEQFPFRDFVTKGDLLNSICITQSFYMRYDRLRRRLALYDLEWLKEFDADMYTPVDKNPPKRNEDKYDYFEPPKFF